MPMGMITSPSLLMMTPAADNSCEPNSLAQVYFTATSDGLTSSHMCRIVAASSAIAAPDIDSKIATHPISRLMLFMRLLIARLGGRRVFLDLQDRRKNLAIAVHFQRHLTQPLLQGLVV